MRVRSLRDSPLLTETEQVHRFICDYTSIFTPGKDYKAIRSANTLLNLKSLLKCFKVSIFNLNLSEIVSATYQSNVTPKIWLSLSELLGVMFCVWGVLAFFQPKYITGIQGKPVYPSSCMLCNGLLSTEVEQVHRFIHDCLCILNVERLTEFSQLTQETTIEITFKA